MINTGHEISALPVVVPLAVVTFAFLLWRLHRRAAVSVSRILVAAAACVYGAGVVANTLFPIYVGRSGYVEPWRVFLNLSPLANTEPFDMLTNVAVFVPLGLLAPLIARASSTWRVLLLGFLVSFTMESLQFLNAITGHGGHVADINDLLANTLGAPIGYVVFRGALSAPVIGRWVEGAVWPRSRAEVAIQRTSQVTHEPM